MSDSELEKAGIFVHTNDPKSSNYRAEAHRFLAEISEKYPDDPVLDHMPKLIFGPFNKAITKEITELSKSNNQIVSDIRLNPKYYKPDNENGYPSDSLFLEDIVKKYNAEPIEITKDTTPQERLHLTKQLIHAICIFYKEGGLLQDMHPTNMFVTPTKQLVIFDLELDFKTFDTESVPGLIQDIFLDNIADSFTNFADIDLIRKFSFKRKLKEVTEIFNSCNGNIAIFEQKILAYIESLYLNQGELRVNRKKVSIDEFIAHLET